MSNAALNARSDAILNVRDELVNPESAASAVSWGAIMAGAVVASALSLALLMLGAGIGLVSVSPWSNNNVSVATFGILAAAWFIAVQLFASGVGGYLAGRLRTVGSTSTRMRSISATLPTALSSGAWARLSLHGCWRPGPRRW